jgi:hypothetical protein
MTRPHIVAIALSLVLLFELGCSPSVKMPPAKSNIVTENKSEFIWRHEPQPDTSNEFLRKHKEDATGKLLETHISYRDGANAIHKFNGLRQLVAARLWDQDHDLSFVIDPKSKTQTLTINKTNCKYLEKMVLEIDSRTNEVKKLNLHLKKIGRCQWTSASCTFTDNPSDPSMPDIEHWTLYFEDGTTPQVRLQCFLTLFYEELEVLDRNGKLVYKETSSNVDYTTLRDDAIFLTAEKTHNCLIFGNNGQITHEGEKVQQLAHSWAGSLLRLKTIGADGKTIVAEEVFGEAKYGNNTYTWENKVAEPMKSLFLTGGNCYFIVNEAWYLRSVAMDFASKHPIQN